MTPPAASKDIPRIVLYDGLCGMCDGLVQFLLRHDKKGVFQFAPQQGEAAKKILSRHALDPASPNPASIETICVIEDYDSPSERLHTKSDAVMRIVDGLGGLWTLALIVRMLPRFLRDACYDVIAHNRYRIFGRRKECRIPSPEDQQKFLS